MLLPFDLLPIIFFRLYQSLILLRNSIQMFDLEVICDSFGLLTILLSFLPLDLEGELSVEAGGSGGHRPLRCPLWQNERVIRELLRSRTLSNVDL